MVSQKPLKMFWNLFGSSRNEKGWFGWAVARSADFLPFSQVFFDACRGAGAWVCRRVSDNRAVN